MGFTKLDSGLLKSSILAESLETFKVWIVLLAACDENGIAEVSPIYLESVCRIPLDKIKEALAVLESPDENSRSENDDGRRVERIDGGFKILNYKKYRIKSYSKSKEAARKREWREKRASECPKASSEKGDITGHVPNVPDNYASASASEDKRKGVPASFEAWWSHYPRKVEKRVAARAYAQAIKAGAKPGELTAALEGYRQQIEKARTEERYIKHASTFLHEDRWRDFLPKPKLTPEEFRAQHEAEVKKGRH